LNKTCLPPGQTLNRLLRAGRIKRISGAWGGTWQTLAASQSVRASQLSPWWPVPAEQLRHQRRAGNLADTAGGKSSRQKLGTAVAGRRRYAACSAKKVMAVEGVPRTGYR
jgi:hypothetical protein